eukprot:g8018.t1
MYSSPYHPCSDGQCRCVHDRRTRLALRGATFANARVLDIGMSHTLVKKNVVNADVSEAVEHEVMHGDLYKLNRKGAWQKRWFRLTDNHLSYYTSERAKTPKATIDLSNCHGIQKLRDGEKYTFGLVRNKTEPYWLKATGDESVVQANMNKWLAELSKRMGVTAKPASTSSKKKIKRDSLIVTKERNKKNVGRVKEQAPSNVNVEIIGGEAGRQTDNLIGNSALRSDKQAANEVAQLDQSEVVNSKAIAISVDHDTKAATESNNERKTFN